MNASCSKCKFFDAFYADSPNGNCRRYAPKPFLVQGAEPTSWTFPEVNGGDWCGEFESTEKQEEE